ncbi:MAG: glycosyltransferase [Thermodesulfobacteriota bacterium]
MLITVARVLPRKGQDTVIKALPAVLAEFPDTYYMIVGDGRYAQNFKELAESMGVSERVIFTGGVGHADVIDYFDLSDAFIMPNRYWNNKIEGLPNVLLEASARGKPVIAGNHGGSVEAVGGRRHRVPRRPRKRKRRVGGRAKTPQGPSARARDG